jgi:hypothetical protein
MLLLKSDPKALVVIHNVKDRPSTRSHGFAGSELLDIQRKYCGLAGAPSFGTRIRAVAKNLLLTYRQQRYAAIQPFVRWQNTCFRGVCRHRPFVSDHFGFVWAGT